MHTKQFLFSLILFSTVGGFAVPAIAGPAAWATDKIPTTLTRSWMGVRIQSVTEELARYYGLETANCVLIAEVISQTPAERAGLQQEDIILYLAGAPVNTTIDETLAQLAETEPGQTVELGIWRDRALISVEVTMEAMPD